MVERLSAFGETENETHRETIVLGTEEGGQYRLRGVWLDMARDAAERVKRGVNAPAHLKGRMEGSRTDTCM